MSAWLPHPLSFYWTQTKSIVSWDKFSSVSPNFEGQILETILINVSFTLQSNFQLYDNIISFMIIIYPQKVWLTLWSQKVWLIRINCFWARSFAFLKMNVLDRENGVDIQHKQNEERLQMSILSSIKRTFNLIELEGAWSYSAFLHDQNEQCETFRCCSVD